jgi:proton-coupled amino acid transporter
VLATTDCKWSVHVNYFILFQMVLFIPMVLVRNLTRLSGLALLADAFIVAGLVYIFWSEIDIIAARGIAEVEFFNTKDFPLFIGSATSPCRCRVVIADCLLF